MNDDISKEYLKEHIKACWINGRPKYSPELHEVLSWIDDVPSAEPEQHEIGYSECANAMLKMWIDNVLTDGEYSRIMDKLNAHWEERRKE